MSLYIAVSDDIALLDPLQVVFSVSQTSSTGCITIPIINDEEVEGDEDFTLSITSAGSAPAGVYLSRED